jgi:hypothetical protein
MEKRLGAPLLQYVFHLEHKCAHQWFQKVDSEGHFNRAKPIVVLVSTLHFLQPLFNLLL